MRSIICLTAFAIALTGCSETSPDILKARKAFEKNLPEGSSPIYSAEKVIDDNLICGHVRLSKGGKLGAYAYHPKTAKVETFGIDALGTDDIAGLVPFSSKCQSKNLI